MRLARAQLRMTVVLAAAVFAAGCGNGDRHDHGPSAKRSAKASGITAVGASADGSGSVSSPASTPATSVQQFAAAYLRFLKGQQAAATLPVATLAVRQTAAVDGILPIRQLAGELKLAAIKPNGDRSWTIEMRAGHHRIYAQVMLGTGPAAEEIVTLVPPDLSTALQPTPRANAAARQPVGSRAAQASADVFLAGYLRFEYGQAKLTAIKDTTARLQRYLQANVPSSVSALHPRVLVLPLRRHGSAWIASPSVTDGVQTYEVIIKLIKEDGRWLADTVKQPH